MESEIWEGDSDAYYAAYATAKKHYLEATLAKVNVEALRSAASRARGEDIACHIPALDNHIDDLDGCLALVASQCGGQNCHLDIEFADGVIRIARIRLDDPKLPPANIQAHVFLSEVATLKYLANTKVPAPHVNGYGLDSPENPVRY
jgi:hypothetical protein